MCHTAKRSGDRAAAAEDVEMKHEPAPMTAVPSESYASGLSTQGSAPVVPAHHSNGAGTGPTAAPVIPTQAPLSHDAAAMGLPPILMAALNQIQQGQGLQQGLPSVDSLQALMQAGTDQAGQQPPMFTKSTE